MHHTLIGLIHLVSADSYGESWDLGDRQGQSCWKELSVWQNPNQAVKKEQKNNIFQSHSISRPRIAKMNLTKGEAQPTAPERNPSPPHLTSPTLLCALRSLKIVQIYSSSNFLFKIIFSPVFNLNPHLYSYILTKFLFVSFFSCFFLLFLFK